MLFSVVVSLLSAFPETNCREAQVRVEKAEDYRGDCRIYDRIYCAHETLLHLEAFKSQAVLVADHLT